MNRKRLAGIIAAGVVVVVPILLFAVVIPALTLPLPPEITPAPDMLTLDCTDPTPASLQARGEVEDTSVGPLSMRGFVYTEEAQGGGPAVIALDNPSFARADFPARWTIVDGIGERSAEKVRIGTLSLKQNVPEDTLARVWQSVSLDIAAGDEFTLGAWVWCDAPDAARVNLFETDVFNVRSAFHPGDSQWHFLTVTGTAAQNADRLRVILSPWRAEGPDYVAYYDGIVLLRGSAVFEHGDFSEGPYSLTIDSLEPDTSYTIRAFGVNAGGPGQGDVVTCRTPAGP